jgi:uncharacterized protein (DUF1330 family)
MHYVVCGGDADLISAAGVRLLADGEMIVLEGPWALGRTRLGVVEDEAALAAVKSKVAHANGAFAVEGIEAPGNGKAFVIAAHKMLDPEGFRPYADAIPGMLARFGVRSLARGGKVTPLAGSFLPDRGVVLEFADPAALVAFYTSEEYAPLLALRLRTTDPRFMVIARSGAIPASMREAANAHLKAHPRGA